MSALTVAIIAGLGLQSWRKQLKGKTEYELAQKYLKAAYKIREALARVRNPILSAAETYEAMKETNIQGNPVTDPKVQTRCEAAVYQRRWQKVQEAFLDLDSISLEAEAFWGKGVKDNLKPLRQCGSILMGNIELHFRQKEKPPREYDSEAEKKRESIIYSFPDDPSDNPFSNEITNAVNLIEDFIRPRLKLYQ